MSRASSSFSISTGIANSMLWVVVFCAFLGTARGLECYECVGKACQDGFGKERVCADKIDTCVTIYANETRTPENVLARNCSLPWMKWEGECNLVQPSGKNSPRAKLKGYMCLCKGDLCNEASALLGAGLLFTTVLSVAGAVLVGRITGRQ